MLWWWCVIFLLLPITSAWSQNGTRVHGIYYVPSMIGLNPYLTFEGPNLYGDYFKPIYVRDLEMISKTANLIRLTGAGLGKIQKDFLDECVKWKVDVAITFSFKMYNLVGRWNSIQLKAVKLAFDTMLESIYEWGKNDRPHEAVKMIVIGDLYDPVFGESIDYPEFWVTQYLDFIKLLTRTVQVQQYDIPVAIQLYVGNTRGVGYIDEIETIIQDKLNSTKSPFAYWIFVLDEEQDVLLDGGLSEVDKELSNLPIPPDGARPNVILEFPASAYNAENSNISASLQNYRMSTLLSEISNNTLFIGQREVHGIIVQEWSDQWWRGDTDNDCTSGLDREYVQSYCQNGFWGLNEQYNTWGQHCIRQREALDTFARFFDSSYVKPLLNEQCVTIWPSLLWNDVSQWFVFPIALLLVLNLILWMIWRRDRKRVRKEISEILDAPRLNSNVHSRMRAESQRRERKGSTVAMVESPSSPLLENVSEEDYLQEEKSIPTDPLEVPGCQLTFILKSTKISPTGKGSNCTKKDLLEFHLREHIRRQKINVDSLIEHERKVLEALTDLGLIGLPHFPQRIYNEAVKNVHTRILEGYHCWLDKQLISEDQRIETDKYAEVLLFRLMISIGEHTAHCPERIAYIFHTIIQGAKLVGDKKCYTIDLDFLHDGLTTGMFSLKKDNLNFDDINDCGILGHRELKKTWHESLGPAVLVDYLRDYNTILFVKSWIFFLAGLWQGWDNSVRFLFCQTESITFFGVTMILFFYQWFYQVRKFPTDRLLGLIFSVCLLAFVFLVIPMIAGTGDNTIYCTAYGLIRVLYSILPHGYLKRLQHKETNLYATQMMGKPKLSRSKFKRSKVQPRTINKRLRYVESLIFWGIIFFSTLLCERFLVLPVSSALSRDSVCYGYDNEVTICSSDRTIFQTNVCITCHVAVILANLLMLVIGLLDTPLIFYALVSFWGYKKGQNQKLSNVYAPQSCVVDLTKNGRERKALENVFGNWERLAYPFWKAMIEELYQRNLINELDKITILRPGKKYNYGALNPEARERLSFFVQSVIKMSNSKRRDMLKWYRKIKKMAESTEEVNVDLKGMMRRKEQYITTQRDDRRKDKIFKSYKYVLAENPEYQKYAALLDDNLQISLIMSEEKLANVDDGSLLFDGLALRMVSESPKCWAPTVSDCWDINNLREESKILKYTSEEKGGVLGQDMILQPEDLSMKELDDWFLRSIPRLSHVITCYFEKIMLSREYLQQRNGQLTNLERLIGLSTYKLEWTYLEENFKKKWDCLDYEQHLLIEFLHAIPSSSKIPRWKKMWIREVRLWASYRAQTIARTIRGALSYHQALKLRLSRFVMKKNGNPCDLKLHDFTELIIAHQTYGSYPKSGVKKHHIVGWKERREDIEEILRIHAEYPILLVYDYVAPPPVQKRNPPKINIGDFDFYWKKQCEEYWKKDEIELKNYWELRCREYQKFGSHLKTNFPAFAHATCIKRMIDGKLTLVSVMPRMNPLRIGGKAKTQGKSANQLNALRCISGHVIQVSDANMDGWIGESLKLPFITREFIDGDVMRNKLGDRTNAIYRIIGFREYIYTTPLGSSAEAMASSQFTFDTLFQRVLADPFDVRIHYGHPDFVDAFWALNRGTLSKASPRINGSEDVFSGYNILLRKEKFTHRDGLEWQKGRETVFTTSSGYLAKVSAGSVAIQRTRDMKNMHLVLSFPKMMALFYGGLCRYLFQILIDYSISLYLLFCWIAAYASITLTDVTDVGNSLGIEWFVALVVVCTFGYIIESVLEFGWATGMVKIVRTLPSILFFYLHQHKCISNSSQEAIRTGEAKYVNTGRPNSFDHYSIRKMYQIYSSSHYYPALNKMLLYYLYIRFIGPTGGLLPLFLVSSITLSWIIVPVIFSPQISDAEVIINDIIEVLNFVGTVRVKIDDKTKEESLDKMWRLREIEAHADNILGWRILYWIMHAIKFFLLWSMAYSAFFDYAIMYVFMFLGHIMITFAYQFSNYSNALRAVWNFFPLMSLLGIKYLSPNDESFTLEALVGLIMFMTGVRLLHWMILIFMTIYIRCIGRCQSDGSKRHKKKRYKKLVGNLFFLMLQYHTHLYSAIIICGIQSAAAFCIMICWWVHGSIERFYKFSLIQSKSKIGLELSRIKTS